jgi:hypothetical protein
MLMTPPWTLQYYSYFIIDITDCIFMKNFTALYMHYACTVSYQEKELRQTENEEGTVKEYFLSAKKIEIPVLL